MKDNENKQERRKYNYKSVYPDKIEEAEKECQFRDFNGDCKLTKLFKMTLFAKENTHCGNILNCYYKRLTQSQHDLKVAREAINNAMGILCEGRTFYEGYFDNYESLGRIDQAIVKLEQGIKDGEQ